MKLLNLHEYVHTSLEGYLQFLRCDKKSGLAKFQYYMSTIISPSFKILQLALWEKIDFEVYVVIYVAAILKFVNFLEIFNFDQEEIIPG